MTSSSPRVPEDPFLVDQNPPAYTSEGENLSYWQSFQEWLLPSESLSKSETPKRDLRYARTLIAIFYAILTGVLVYTVVRLVYSGRIEVFTNMYKVDFVEAPSLALCPFNANDRIEWPHGAGPWVAATKVAYKGISDLKVAPRNCTFDNRCVCVDLSAYRLRDFERNHTNRDEVSAVSDAEMFRESIEVRTNLSDPSDESVLKVGLYDSRDPAPDWLYVNQGSVFIAQLELIVWTIIDISVSGLVKTLMGDLRAMAKNRDIFRYTSQEVGNNRRNHSWHETSIRYEMKTFFVEETMSSARAFSLYTVGVLVALVALRIVIIDAFFLVIIPPHAERAKKEEDIVRELSPTAVWLRNLCFFCCFPQDKEGEKDEKRPLLLRRGTV